MKAENQVCSTSRPAVLIVGAQKAGTTTIHRALAASGQFALPKVKEPQFFALEESFAREQAQRYLDLFEGEGPLLDASTMYLANASACQLAAAFFTDAKIIICKRPLADRAVSAYFHQLRKGPLVERRLFAEICRDLLEHAETFGDIAVAEQRALEKALERGTISPDWYSGSYFSYLHPEAARIRIQLADPLQPFRYFGNGLMSRHIGTWRTAFANRVCIIDFGDIQYHPSRVIDRLEDFLAIELRSRSESSQSTLQRTNAAIAPRSGWLAAAYMNASRTGLRRLLPATIRVPLRKLFQRVAYTRSTPSVADIDMARTVAKVYGEQ